MVSRSDEGGHWEAGGVHEHRATAISIAVAGRMTQLGQEVLRCGMATPEVGSGGPMSAGGQRRECGLRQHVRRQVRGRQPVDPAAIGEKLRPHLLLGTGSRPRHEQRRLVQRQNLRRGVVASHRDHHVRCTEVGQRVVHGANHVDGEAAGQPRQLAVLRAGKEGSGHDHHHAGPLVVDGRHSTHQRCEQPVRVSAAARHGDDQIAVRCIAQVALAQFVGGRRERERRADVAAVTQPATHPFRQVVLGRHVEDITRSVDQHVVEVLLHRLERTLQMPPLTNNRRRVQDVAQTQNDPLSRCLSAPPASVPAHPSHRAACDRPGRHRARTSARPTE